MRKNKKLLGIALVPCMVGSLLAGCTASSENTDATPSSAAESSAEETTKASDEEETTKAPETDEEETTKAPEQQGAGDGQGAAFIDVLKGISDMESYSMNSSITVNQKTTVDGETDETAVKLGVKGLTDGKGNISVTISADYDDEDSISLHGDLFTISKVDDRMYLDLSSLYNTVMEELGSESAVIEQYAEAFDVSMEELESLMVLGIPVGDLAFSKDDYAKMQDALDLIYDDMAVAIDSMGEDCLTQEGNTYTITVNNDNVIDVVDALFSAFEGNIGDIYDAYVAGMKDTDYSVYLETVINAIVDEVIDGIETATETELDEKQRAELEAEIQSAIEEYQTTMEEAVTELENGKDEFVEEFNSAVKEFNDSKEDTKAAIADGDTSANAIMTVAVDGEKGSRKITSDLTMDVETTQMVSLSEDDTEESEVTSFISVAIKTTVEEGDVEITAPEEYAPLSKAVEVAYRVYLLYQEAQGGQGGEDDPSVEPNTDPSTGDDDYNFEYDSYTQAEMEKNYGVTLKEGQALACDTLDNDGVLITAYDGMEFFKPDDMSSMMMEVNENSDAFITIFVYDNSFDEDFYKTYYENVEKLEENLYYCEDNESVTLISFAENITIQISLETETADIMKDITGGDNEKFMKGLLDLCEIVPAP